MKYGLQQKKLQQRKKKKKKIPRLVDEARNKMLNVGVN